MKKFVLALICLYCSSSLFAQDNRDNNNRNNQRTHNGNRNQAPTAVQQAWQRDHANDGTPTWQQSNGQWNATYQDRQTNKRINTYYDRSGREIDTHREWDRNNLSSDYNNNINRRYHSHNYNVRRIERPNQKEVYELRMKNRGRTRTIYTDENGNEIRYREPHRY
ncbi:MAG TPA: hypothetical protein VGO09_02690 [Flavisolibacter sp.]|nr:hypothetical protein [Flavisolibacter sp.]